MIANNDIATRYRIARNQEKAQAKREGRRVDTPWLRYDESIPEETAILKAEDAALEVVMDTDFLFMNQDGDMLNAIRLGMPE